MFMLDYFLYTQPEVACSMVCYRIDTLPGALEKAQSYGWQGAFYAWESQEGGYDACSDYNVTDVFTGRPVRTYFKDKQVHISAAVARAVMLYTEVTSDYSLLAEGGARTVLECARFYYSLLVRRSSSTDLYERLARYCDEQISKAILGQTLTSDSGGGSYAQSKTHNDVRHDLTVADCKALASTLRRDLIRPLCIFNFGEDKRIPEIQFDCEEGEDLEQTANILDVLIGKIGLRVPTSYIYKKFSIPEPEPDEEVATPTPQPGWASFPSRRSRPRRPSR